MWPFKKAPKPSQVPPKAPIDRREWNEDWQLGDIAVCVHGDCWPDNDPRNPKKDERRIVTGIQDAIALPSGVRIYALNFMVFPSGLGWACTAFRKVRPSEKSETREAFADLTISDPEWWEKQSPETAPPPEKERDPTEVRQGTCSVKD